MTLIPTSSKRLGRLGRFPPIWGGGASAKNGGDLAERGRGGKPLGWRDRDEVREKTNFGEGGARPQTGPELKGLSHKYDFNIML